MRVDACCSSRRECAPPSCIYIYIYICIHTYTYIYIHTEPGGRPGGATPTYPRCFGVNALSAFRVFRGKRCSRSQGSGFRFLPEARGRPSGATPTYRGVVVTEAGSYLRRIDSCITQLKAQGPCRTRNESKEEEEATRVQRFRFGAWGKDFRIWGLVLTVYDLWLRVQGLLSTYRCI